MQVSPSSALVRAASVASQLTAKDGSAAGGRPADAPANPNSIHVDHAGASNPDRDAQGQGDGLGDEHSDRKPAEDSAGEKKRSSQTLNQPSALLPGEDPGELDIVG